MLQDKIVKNKSYSYDELNKLSKKIMDEYLIVDNNNRVNLRDLILAFYYGKSFAEWLNMANSITDHDDDNEYCCYVLATEKLKEFECLLRNNIDSLLSNVDIQQTFN